MSARRTFLPLLAVALAAPLVVCAARAFADGDPATPPPVDLIPQSDRKKMTSINVPRTWKTIPGERADEKAVLQMEGFFGEPEKSPNGAVFVYVANQFGRAALARAIEMPQVGAVKPEAARQGAGWAESCAVAQSGHVAEWRRYVEKNGRVYQFRVQAAAGAYDTVHAQVEKMLDTAAVPGDFAPPALAAGWTAKKFGDFDVATDSGPDREKSVKKQADLFSAGRDVLTKALPGKPFDAGRPAAWVFQNATKYEDKSKAAVGVAPKFATYDPVDRCALVELMSETQKEHDENVCGAGAAQYVWQYFGGETPPWISVGLSNYGQLNALTKGKLPSDVLVKCKTAVAAGKRRLNEWFDVGIEVAIDADTGPYELAAWHWYFRAGRGAKKYKKQYDGFLQSLRDTGDPAAARKSFDGVNFDEMLQDFKAWADKEWK